MEEFTERNSSASALKGSGHNRTKGTVGRGGKDNKPQHILSPEWRQTWTYNGCGEEWLAGKDTTEPRIEPLTSENRGRCSNCYSCMSLVMGLYFALSVTSSSSSLLNCALFNKFSKPRTIVVAVINSSMELFLGKPPKNENFIKANNSCKLHYSMNFIKKRKIPNPRYSIAAIIWC